MDSFELTAVLVATAVILVIASLVIFGPGLKRRLASAAGSGEGEAAEGGGFHGFFGFGGDSSCHSGSHGGGDCGGGDGGGGGGGD